MLVIRRRVSGGDTSRSNGNTSADDASSRSNGNKHLPKVEHPGSLISSWIQIRSVEAQFITIQVI